MLWVAGIARQAQAGADIIAHMSAKEVLEALLAQVGRPEHSGGGEHSAVCVDVAHPLDIAHHQLALVPVVGEMPEGLRACIHCLVRVPACIHLAHVSIVPCVFVRVCVQ